MMKESIYKITYSCIIFTFRYSLIVCGAWRFRRMTLYKNTAYAKGFATISIGILLLTPLLSYAQEAALDTPVQQSPSAPVEEVAAPDAPAASAEPQIAAASTAEVARPTIDAPQLFTHGSLAPKVSETTGALTERVELALPPGRGGMTPDLALVYNSQDRKDSIVGYGWSLSIPYIERLNKTGSERMYVDNYFSASQGGELVAAVEANEYRQRIDDGTLYVFKNNVWTAFDKKGIRYTYGQTQAGRQFAAEDPAKVARWMLQEIRDTNDNRIVYAYAKEGSTLYPASITYTNSGATAGAFAVRFAYEARPDTLVSHATGFAVTLQKRLKAVTVLAEGTVVTKYALTYVPGNNGVRSLLSALQQTGYSDGGQQQRPAIQFTYSATPPTYTPKESSQLYNAAHVAADADGNGLPDFALSYQNPVSLQKWMSVDLNMYSVVANRLYPNMPEHWSISVAAPDNYRPAEEGVRFFDANGDGKADIVRSIRMRDGELRQAYYQNESVGSGLSWIPKPNTGLPIFAYNRMRNSYEDVTYSTGLFGNVNGDGLVDYVFSLPQIVYSGLDGTYLHTSEQAGWEFATSTFSPVATMPITTDDTTASQLVDINSDGLDDWMVSAGPATYFCLNTGTGWEANCENGWKIATTTRQETGWDKGIRFIDMNADGLPDYVRAYHMPQYQYLTNGAKPIDTKIYNYVYLNTGSGWATSTLQMPSFIFLGHPTSVSWGGDVEYDEYVDWNGDGFLDSSHMQSEGMIPDVLTTVTYPTGGSIGVTYAFSTKSGENPDLAFPMLLVTDITVNNGLGRSDKTTYSYAGGKWHIPGDVRERRFAGFAKVTAVDPNKTVVTYFNQGDAVSGDGEQSDHVAQIGRAYREDILSPSGALERKTLTRYQTFDQNGAYKVLPVQEVSQDYNQNDTHRDAAKTYTYDPLTGDLLQEVQWGEVAGLANGSFTDMGADTYTAIMRYAPGTAKAMRVLVSETKTDSAGSKLAEAKHYYDGLPLGSATRGMETKTERWQQGAVYSTTLRAYNAQGLLTQETDPRGNTTAYTYDARLLYPSVVRNALGQQETYAYNYAFGTVVQKTDANGAVYQTQYDPLGRVAEVRVPELGATAVKTRYHYTDTVPTMVKKIDYLDSAVSTAAVTYYDGLGHAVQERKQMEDGMFGVIDYQYDTAGLLLSDSLPYAAGGAEARLGQAPLTLKRTYTYTPLGDVASVTNAVGVTTFARDDWSTRVTDAKGKQKVLYTDAHGNLAQVDEQLGGSTYTTRYAYQLGLLTRISDALSNVRAFAYDGLGNRVRAEDLHAPSDTQFGVWVYEYDAASNLMQSKNQAGQVVRYAYDSLNRVTSEDFLGAGGIESAFTYDACAFGVGRLCTATMRPGVATAYTYNPQGLVAIEQKTIGAGVYATAYAYNRQGQVTHMLHPDNLETRYTYNTAGLLESVLGGKVGGTLVGASNINYSPAGQVSGMWYTNNTVTTNTYDPNKLYWLKTRQTVGPNNTMVQNLSYVYDPVGNITRITDAADANDVKMSLFAYDDLHRLVIASTTAATTTPTYRYVYRYNPLGNMVSDSTTTYTYAGTGYANPHAPTDLRTGSSTTTYTYDPLGNLTHRGDTTHTFDYQSRLTQTNIGTSTKVTYRYDHQDNRVLVHDGIQTLYPTHHYSKQGATSTLSLFAGDTLIATLESKATRTTPTYIHTDHLGSTQHTTNQQGAVTQTLQYYPYGEAQAHTGTATQREYIGQVHDEASGLLYLNARYYMGRGQFLSEDPVFWEVGQSLEDSDIMHSHQTGLYAVPGYDNTLGKKSKASVQEEFLLDPQMQNSYGYARNNPINRKDPTGELPILPILAVYSVMQNLINLYEAKTVFLDYPEVFTSQEKWQTGFKVGFDAAIFGAGRATKDIATKTFLQVGPVILDVTDHFFAPQIYQNIDQSQTKNRSPILTGYNQAQLSAMSSFAQSFGFSTLSPMQVKAVEQVRAVFSK